ncbi:hypothetical protein DICA2_C15148 [Diutina catenulata]
MSPRRAARPRARDPGHVSLEPPPPSQFPVTLRVAPSALATVATRPHRYFVTLRLPPQSLRSVVEPGFYSSESEFPSDFDTLERELNEVLTSTSPRRKQQRSAPVVTVEPEQAPGPTPPTPPKSQPPQTPPAAGPDSESVSEASDDDMPLRSSQPRSQPRSQASNSLSTPRDSAGASWDPELTAEKKQAQAGDAPADASDSDSISEVTPPPKKPVDPSSSLLSIPKTMSDLLAQDLPPIDDMVSSTVVSLLDPLSVTRIATPVKSLFCVHFECFDFDTFCLHNKISPGIALACRKSVFANSAQRLRTTAAKGALQIARRRYTAVPESAARYQCPHCDRAFTLSQLMLSEPFHYFIKCTRAQVVKVEITDLQHYRPIDDQIERQQRELSEDLVVLSDDDDDDIPAPPPVREPQAPPQLPDKYAFVHWGIALPPILQTPFQGQGTDDDPITLD